MVALCSLLKVVLLQCFYAQNTGDVASQAHTKAGENPLASYSHDEK